MDNVEEMNFFERISNVFLFLLISVDCFLLIFSAVSSLSSDFYNFVILFDLFTCLVLFVEFCIRYKRADDKKYFLKHNFWEIISFIPVSIFLFRTFKFIRFIRLIRFVGVLKIFVLFKKDLQNLSNLLKESYLDKLVLLAFMVILFSSLFIYFVDPIKISLIDSFWYVITTITTVGYGDIVPHSPEGKILGMILVVMGVLSISVLTGSISAVYSNKVIVDEDHELLKQEVHDLNKKVDNLTKMVEELSNKKD